MAEEGGREREVNPLAEEGERERLTLWQRRERERLTLWQRRERETFIYPLAEEGEREVNQKVSAYIYELDCGYVMLTKLQDYCVHMLLTL